LASTQIFEIAFDVRKNPIDALLAGFEMEP
jgi:hypothetical protein